MTKRYLLDGFVDVEEGDTVVDVGAYVGTFAALAAPAAETVYCFEPDQSNFHCLQKNVERFDNVTPIDRGVWSETGDVSFRTSPDSSDSAVLSGGSNATVSVVSLADFAAEHGIESIDFLKVDVEGFEHHVVEGIGDLDVEKVSVDCSEGDDNVRTVIEWLTAHGYDVATRGHLVYARSSESDGPRRRSDVPTPAFRSERT